MAEKFDSRAHKIKEKFGLRDFVKFKWANMDIVGQIIGVAVVRNKYLVSFKIARRYTAQWMDGSVLTRYSGEI